MLSIPEEKLLSSEAVHTMYLAKKLSPYSSEIQGKGSIMTDWLTVVSSIASSVGVTAVSAWWLGRAWITHKLNSELEKRKGTIKKEVETELADNAAQRSYEFSAKQRLYTAIGPLKFQLLIACRDLFKHVNTYGIEGVQYSLEPTNYYGKSTLFRIVIPLVIVELIERHIAIADFSVDPEAVELLRFKKAAYRAYKSDEVILQHPDACWDEQHQHLFHHTISKMIEAMIVSDPVMGNRALYFQEFEELLSNEDRIESIAPLILIIKDFSINKKPIFWVRLVFLAYICSRLIDKLGFKIGFQQVVLDTRKLLALSNDKYIKKNIENLVEKFNTLEIEGL